MNDMEGSAMTLFEKLVLRKLLIIMKLVVLNGKPDADLVMWCEDVVKATGDEKLSVPNLDRATR